MSLPGDLAVLVLELNAAVLAYQAAIDAQALGSNAQRIRRIGACREALHLASARVAAWADARDDEPEAHGSRRTGDREIARSIAARVRCRSCDGSGLRQPFAVDPCHACAGTGAS